MPASPLPEDMRDLIVELRTTVKLGFEGVNVRLDKIEKAQANQQEQIDALDKRLGTVETDRARMIPTYQTFFHKVNNHLTADAAWKAAHDKEQETTRRHGYTMSVVIGLCASVGTILARVLIGV